jgi:hypothetical protein
MGESVLYNSSGATPDEPKWSMGESRLIYEYVAATGGVAPARKPTKVMLLTDAWQWLKDWLNPKAWAWRLN